MKNVNTALEEGWSVNPEGRSTPWMLGLMLAFLALAIAAPRLRALDRLVTPDEYMWLTRSANYFMAISQREPAWTYQKEHPGVTVMWAGAAGLLLRYPQYRSSGLGQVDPDQFHSYLRTVKEVTPLEILVAGRVFMVLGHTLILLVSFLYASRLIGPMPAFISFLLVAFEPYHVALTRLLHLDGLLGNLMLLSLLAFISYVDRRRVLDLVVSAVAAGLGLLTKLPAILMVPVAGLLTVYACWRGEDFQQNKSFSLLIKMAVQAFGAWSLIVALTFFTLWPAMWVRPAQTLADMLSQGTAYIESGHASPVFFNGAIIPDGDLGIKYWYFYPLTYLWRSTPVVLAGLVLAVVAFLKKHNMLICPPRRLVLLGLLLFIGVFTAAMSISEKKFDRYLIPVYAPLNIIAGLGWSALAQSLWKMPFGHQRYSPFAIIPAVIVLQAALTLNTYPYYLSYYNPLLGGSYLAQKVMSIGWGEGLDQAAQYLNKKPHAKELKVMAYHSAGCFSYYFKGRVRDIPYSANLTDERWQKFIESDYAVIYISQRQRNIPTAILEYVAYLNPEHTIWINGFEYVRIYKLH